MISDLHLGKGVSVNKAKEQLVTLCSKIRTDFSPKETILFVIMGDIINASDTTAFADARVCLNCLREELRGYTVKFEFVPGNHDLPAGNIDPFDKFIAEYGATCPFGGAAAYSKVYDDIYDLCELSKETYNDVAYSKSCGRTDHHYKDGIAFKFEDDLFETRLRDIEWTPSRFGPIAPVAVLDPVIIEGCEITHASLHNVSFIESKELSVGCRVLISKRNMIIPQIEENLDRGGYVESQMIPAVCPCCQQPTKIRESEPDKDGKIVKVLYCDNEDCDSRKLKKFVHFASKKAMNIEGLAEGTLEKLIGRGWLHSFMDIYELDRHRGEIIAMDGFGEKSWQKIWDAIQKSRNTTFERFLIAMDIPLIGSNASEALCKVFSGDLDAFVGAVEDMYDFRQIPDIGETMHNNIYQWFWNEENYCMWFEMRDLFTIEKPAEESKVIQQNPFMGKTIVVTGKVEPYTRDEIHGIIESLGAHAGSSVSSKTNYLICGEKAGSKLDKARSLGVQVITPLEFFSMVQAV